MNKKDNEVFEKWITGMKTESKLPAVRSYYVNNHYKFLNAWDVCCDYKNQELKNIIDDLKDILDQEALGYNKITEIYNLLDTINKGIK